MARVVIVVGRMVRVNTKSGSYYGLRAQGYGLQAPYRKP
jgi:hypothetical protein